MTGPRIRVMTALLDDVRGDHWGYELMKKTGLASGTLYPILDALCEVGWLCSHSEEVDPAVVGRPRRRYYVVTGEGALAMPNHIAATFHNWPSIPAWGNA